VADHSEDEKRANIRKYFDGSSAALAWTLIVLGLPFLFAYGFGLVLIAIGIYLLWRRRSDLSDKQIDRWTAEDYAAHNFLLRAWQMSGFDEQIRHVSLQGIAAGTNLADDVFSGEIVGDDGVLRSTPMSATVILCGQDQMGIYQTGLDLTTGNRVNERFFEVFYQDVVAVSVGYRSNSLNLKQVESGLRGANLNLAEVQKGLTRKKQRMNLRKLRSIFSQHIIADVLQRDLVKVYRIDLANGEHIVIPTRYGLPTRVANAQDDAQSGDEIARSMAAVRAIVREKKRAALRAEAAGAGPLV
jgi:hypothetical protein